MPRISPMVFVENNQADDMTQCAAMRFAIMARIRNAVCTDLFSSSRTIFENPKENQMAFKKLNVRWKASVELKR
jgi:hypothetical protein